MPFNIDQPTPSPWKKLFPVARVIGEKAFHLVLPPRCLACDRLVSEHGGLCVSCWRDLAFIEYPVCDCTGAPLAYDLGGKIVSADALANPPDYTRLRAALRYEGAAQRLITAFKYQDRLDLTKPLARFTMRAARELLTETDVIVPVPLHRARFFKRRFNQAAELAKVIARASDKPTALNALMRIRNTPQQVSLDPMERARNVQGAFRVKPEHRIKIAGRAVLLVDDVVTTGATVNACARALLREGACRVDVAAVAKVVNNGDGAI
ncbi:MAG: ComF family protein [Pseudomonadota bacterium]